MTAETAALTLGALPASRRVSAQSVGAQHSLPDLTGLYRCVRNCAGAAPARVLQRGWELDLTNEAGGPVKAWIDRLGHINSYSWSKCAIYRRMAPIQFNSGVIRVLLQPGAWRRMEPVVSDGSKNWLTPSSGQHLAQARQGMAQNR
jgi:hypothetical protein